MAIDARVRCGFVNVSSARELARDFLTCSRTPMPFRISQEHNAGAPGTFKLAGRLTGDAIDVLVDACMEIAAGMILDLSEISYADDAGVKALGALRARGAVLQGSRPYLALLLKQEEIRERQGSGNL